MSRIARITISLLAATLAVGLFASVLALIGVGPSLAAVRPRLPGLCASGAALAAVTATCLLLRFMRWQFVLRRLDLRVPAVPGLGAYVSSFAFLPIPLFVGQLVARHRLLPAPFRRSRSTVVVAFLWERGFDAWALALFGSLAGSNALRLAFLVATAAWLVPQLRRAALGGVLAGLDEIARRATGEAVGFDDRTVAQAQSRVVLAVGALSALAVWLPVVVSISIPGLAAGADVAWIEWTSAAARSILFGAASGVPFGAGVSGFVLLGDFAELGVDVAAAAVIVFVFRMTTTWFTLALAAIALVATRRRLSREPQRDHFDTIDHCYDAWLPDHYRAHVVRKKTEPMIDRLARLARDPIGLDLGCGRGWYVDVMQKAGARTVGTDLSARQLRAARAHTGSSLLIQATADQLPFADGAFDFAYAINVLHHVPSSRHQELALREIARVVRPGALVFVHDMNPRNPLFRWYVSYLFPILKGIDEGTEHFMDPRRLPRVPELALREVRYATFTPDFAPAALMPALAALERRLERSPLAPYGAHFLAVFERVGETGRSAA